LHPIFKVYWVVYTTLARIGGGGVKRIGAIKFSGMVEFLHLAEKAHLLLLAKDPELTAKIFAVPLRVVEFRTGKRNPRFEGLIFINQRFLDWGEEGLAAALIFDYFEKTRGVPLAFLDSASWLTNHGFPRATIDSMILATQAWHR
jgi:hypothetical protein